MAYFAYFHSIIRYGIIFWGNATNSCKVFLKKNGWGGNKNCLEQNQEHLVEVCLGKLEILPVPCQYILSLILFIIDNPNNFQTSLEIHGLHTRSKNQLFVPISTLTSVHKGITYSDIKIYDSLLTNILNLKNDRRQFKNE